MGLFSVQPEEPDEWGGIPSEPLKRDDETDLEPAVSDDALQIGFGADVSSVSVSWVPVETPDANGNDAGPAAP